MPPDPLYFTDAERHVRHEGSRRRYRFSLTFRLRNTLYTRWFRSPEDRASYLPTIEGAVLISEGEEK